MRYIIVANATTDMSPMTIYDRVNSLHEARERCEKLAAETPNSTFSYYEWAGAYQSETKIQTTKLWDNPWTPPIEVMEESPAES